MAVSSATHDHDGTSTGSKLVGVPPTSSSTGSGAGARTGTGAGVGGAGKGADFRSGEGGSGLYGSPVVEGSCFTGTTGFEIEGGKRIEGISWFWDFTTPTAVATKATRPANLPPFAD